MPSFPIFHQFVITDSEISHLRWWTKNATALAEKPFPGIKEVIPRDRENRSCMLAEKYNFDPRVGISQAHSLGVASSVGSSVM